MEQIVYRISNSLWANNESWCNYDCTFSRNWIAISGPMRKDVIERNVG